MKEKKYLILGIATVLITLIGVTYAYFTTRIIGDRKNVTVDMAELKIIFTNGDAIEASDVYAEDNLDIVKTFSVENKTKNEYKYNIVIEDLVNTFKTTGYISLSKFSENGNDPMYGGYMYGTSGSLENNRTNTNDSTIKTVIDAWYENNLLTNYDKYVSKTAIYCNDRSTQNNSYVIDDSFIYSGITRLYSSDAPSYKCGANTNNGLFEDTQAVEDKFSASTTGGGKSYTKLSSPYAWYYTNSEGGSITGTKLWWLISSFYWDISRSYVFRVVGFGEPGYLDYIGVDVSEEVRPAISLSSCVTIKSGTGTPETPYEIDYDGSCN